MEPLIELFQSKIHILIAGAAAPGDPYGQLCTERMKVLRSKHPRNFWGDGTMMFRDHRFHLFAGSDFGIMFSKFEPGGLVHLEYFSGTTPVIATKTGGLKDTITPLSADGTGCGVLIESNTPGALIAAVKVAQKFFLDKPLFKQIRAGCYDCAIDTRTGAEKYLQEFYRISNRVLIASLRYTSTVPRQRLVTSARLSPAEGQPCTTHKRTPWK